MDEAFYDPRQEQVLQKLSTTIDRNDLRNAEMDAREQRVLEWKQVNKDEDFTYFENIKMFIVSVN